MGTRGTLAGMAVLLGSWLAAGALPLQVPDLKPPQRSSGARLAALRRWSRMGP